jgi:hypothetical protein
MNPQKDDGDCKSQGNWYVPASKEWSLDGPCKGIGSGDKAEFPIAETIKAKRIIYFCPKAWALAEKGSWKKDLAQLRTAISTDGTAYLDHYQSPGSTLLHKMTHQLADTGMLSISSKNVKNMLILARQMTTLATTLSVSIWEELRANLH